MRGCETDFGGSLGSRVSQCTDYRGEEVMLRLPRRPALPPALPPARTPPPRPPLPIFSLFPSSPPRPHPAAVRRLPAGWPAGGAGRERVLWEVRERRHSVAGAHMRAARRGGRDRVASLPLLRQIPCVGAARLPPAPGALSRSGN